MAEKPWLDKMVDIKDNNLVRKDPGEDYRNKGGHSRMYITRGERESRRMWQRVGVKRKSLAGNRANEMTPVEHLVSDMLESIEYSYDDLAPVASSFVLVEESVRLYKGDPEDWRYKKDTKVPFVDANNAGMSRSGVGRTSKRPWHGWTCECWQCRGLKEPDESDRLKKWNPGK